MATDPMASAWETQRAAMGAFIRSQREMANLSLREMSRMTRVSNAYLSQVERGLHDPTLRVLVQIGDALHLSVEEMLRRQSESSAGCRSEAEPGTDGAVADELVAAGPLGVEAVAAGPLGVEAAIAGDPVLSDPEKEALCAVYRSYLHAAVERARSAPEGDTAAPAQARPDLSPDHP